MGTPSRIYAPSKGENTPNRWKTPFIKEAGAVVSPHSTSLQVRDALLKGLKAKANLKLQEVFQN